LKGFEKEKIEKILKLDTSIYQVSLIFSLGYNNKIPRNSIKLDFKYVVDFIV
jgi:hypothetical protein